jgi:predicted nucleotidyltransferase
MRPSAEDAARELVVDRYPDAIQAWLAGSTTTGRETATSDLDVTVLLGDDLLAGIEVHRESLEHAGWPVELFVHTAASIEHFVAQDLRRRHPTMARLVASGIPLLGSGGADVRRRCEEVLARGPGPVPADDLELIRYGLSDLLDDLSDDRPPAEVTAVAVSVWSATAELALAGAGSWAGTGKWLVRELADLDARGGTRLCADLDAALRQAVAGDTTPLRGLADQVLARHGGRYWAGLYRAADLP